MKTITSTNNPLIKKYQKLKLKKYRDQAKLFLIEGKNLIAEARNHNLLKEVLTSNPQKSGTQVSSKIINALTSTKTPQDTIGICYMQEAKIIGNRILALDNIQDPGNLGTLIRTAKAFGWDGVLVSGVDQYNAKVIRATQGAFFSIPIMRTHDIAQYFPGYSVYAAILNKQATIYNQVQLAPRIILVLGNEGQGIAAHLIKQANETIYIPVHFASLNVAQAGAILLHAYQKLS